jgi:ATP-dependent protease HslVU (ClpYQ) peptidase subunit
MTCIMGMIEDGQTYIATDGFATTEDCERKHILCRKLFVSDKHDYVVAFAGHIRTGQLLYPESGFEFPDSIYQIPNHMFLWLNQFETLGKDEIQSTIMQSNFIIATREKLYIVLMDLQISEVDPEFGYVALGSGTPFAMGSLHTSGQLGDYLTPKERLELAMDAASASIKNVGKPYTIVSYDEAIAQYKYKKPRTKRKTRTKKT